MARHKGSASAVGDIPEGPLVEILSRVPAKSVCRFKCVSSAWRDLIADTHYRKKLPQAMRGLFCMTEAAAGGGNVESLGFSFVDLMEGSAPLDIDASFSFLTELPDIKVLLLQDSCNGLILFEHREEVRSGRLGYIVCNPTTKEWEAVPACGSQTLLNYPYLAFDPAVSSHFHLVQFQLEYDEEFLSVHAYSSETGTWSNNQIGEQGEQGQLEGWHHQAGFSIANPPRCPFVNGFLHLMVWGPDNPLIVAFDVQGKARMMITVPHVADGRHWSFSYFGQSQGHLHYITQEILDGNANAERYKLSIWVLQDYDAQEWVLKYTVDSLEIFGEQSCQGTLDFEVVDIHQDCNVVVFNHSSEHKLVAYDMGSKEVNVIATLENEMEVTGRYIPYFSESPVLTNKQ